MNKLMIVLLLAPLSLTAQRDSSHANQVPRDTSFTVFSAAEKVLLQYPYARIVMPEIPRGVVSFGSIVYSSIGERKLLLDVFRPERKGTYPAVLLVHGGGWRSGDRSEGIPLALRLASAGYVAVTVEYRLSIEAIYPAAVLDLKAAVRWLRVHGSEYLIDSTRIAIMGFSAGGELAAFLGNTNGERRYEGKGGNKEHSSSVQAVVDVDGILDFTDPAESGKDTVPGKPSAGTFWFGGTFRERKDLWIEASPLSHVNRKSAPILFINSSLPRYHAGRDAMIEKLDSLGIYADVRMIPNTPHPFWLFHPWFEPTCRFAIEFLDRVLATHRR